jgi:hypothetical protein
LLIGFTESLQLLTTNRDYAHTVPQTLYISLEHAHKPTQVALSVFWHVHIPLGSRNVLEFQTQQFMAASSTESQEQLFNLHLLLLLTDRLM